MRDEYVNYNEVITEIDSYLKSSPSLDYITFSGAGPSTWPSRVNVGASVFEHAKRTKNKADKYKQVVFLYI